MADIECARTLLPAVSEKVQDATLEYSFHERCAQRCPILRGLVTTQLIRQAIGEVTGEEVSLNQLVIEAQDRGDLPKKCENGPRTTSENDFRSADRHLSVDEYIDANGIDPWGKIVFTVCEQTHRKMKRY